jgi:choline dehydrogenase
MPDFDDWQAKFGVHNWSSSHMLPYFLKSEDFTSVADKDCNASHHNLGGPLPVGFEKFNPVFMTPFLEAAKLQGHSIGDYNGESQLRFNRVQSIKSQGRRVTTKRAYLDAGKGRRNLHVLTFAHVTRILFDPSRKAVGVEYLRENKVYRSLALNEIVISAGALRSPQLLLLSGIGHPDHLNKSNIQTIAELPGVGSNLHDHVYSMIHFSVNSTDTLKPFRVNQLNHYLSYRADGVGPLTSTGECGHGFFRTSNAGNESLGANAKIAYHALSPMSFPEEEFWRSAMAFKKSIWNRYFTPYYPEETTSMSIGLMKPKSRG